MPKYCLMLEKFILGGNRCQSIARYWKSLDQGVTDAKVFDAVKVCIRRKQMPNYRWMLEQFLLGGNRYQSIAQCWKS